MVLNTYKRFSGQTQLGSLPHLGSQQVSATDVQQPKVPHYPVTENISVSARKYLDIDRPDGSLARPWSSDDERVGLVTT